MPFKKGESGNPTGKPKGANSERTNKLRSWVTAFIEKNTEQIEADWLRLDPKERIAMFEKLLKYTLPALQATSTNLKFEDLTEDQLDEIINKLKEGNGN
ncbi:MAG: DUF5681 domain-containing protein [Ginsengibacter sp.]